MTREFDQPMQSEQSESVYGTRDDDMQMSRRGFFIATGTILGLTAVTAAYEITEINDQRGLSMWEAQALGNIRPIAARLRTDIQMTDEPFDSMAFPASSTIGEAASRRHRDWGNAVLLQVDPQEFDEVMRQGALPGAAIRNYGEDWRIYTTARGQFTEVRDQFGGGAVEAALSFDPVGMEAALGYVQDGTFQGLHNEGIGPIHIGDLEADNGHPIAFIAQ